jgi:hypothetical protein
MVGLSDMVIGHWSLVTGHWSLVIGKPVGDADWPEN